MLDQILTLQTLAGTVSGAAMTLVLSACAQRVPWPSIRSARDVSQKADRAASGPAPLAAGPPVSAAAPAPEQPETALPSSAPPRVLAHYQDGLTHKTRVAPVKAAVLPLSRHADLSPAARDLAAELRQYWNIEFDDAGAIGRRYRRQDEIGTPFCVTLDFDSLEDQAVTIRERDSMSQERVAIAEVSNYLATRLKGS